MFSFRPGYSYFLWCCNYANSYSCSTFAIACYYHKWAWPTARAHSAFIDLLGMLRSEVDYDNAHYLGEVEWRRLLLTLQTGGRFSQDCELIRLVGVSERLVSCLNCCFGAPRSGDMRRTCDYMCRSFCIKVAVIPGSVAIFLLDSNQCRPASPIFYNFSTDAVMEDLCLSMDETKKIS